MKTVENYPKELPNDFVIVQTTLIIFKS